MGYLIKIACSSIALLKNTCYFHCFECCPIHFTNPYKFLLPTSKSETERNKTIVPLIFKHTRQQRLFSLLERERERESENKYTVK